MNRRLDKGYRPGIVLIDSSYGNNASFLKELENKKLKYIGGIVKNRNILVKTLVKRIRRNKIRRVCPMDIV